MATHFRAQPPPARPVATDSAATVPQHATTYTAVMMMSTDHHADWIDAANRLLAADVMIVSEADRTVRHDETDVRIRMWPPDTTVERAQAIRDVLVSVPESAGVPQPVGDPSRVVLAGGRVYDACAVLEGLPLNRHGQFTVEGYGNVAIPLHDTADHGDMLVQAARHLGQIHQASRASVDRERTGHLSARDRFKTASLSWQESRRQLGRQAEELTEVRRWLRCGNRIIPIADDRLRAAGDDATATPVLIHGDIWPAWLVVDDPSRPQVLHGIDGWTTALAGSPVIDLAALSARVTGWSAEHVEEVLGAYSEVAQLSPGARRLVPVVAAVDLLDQLGRLLHIAFVDDRVANDPAQPFIRSGIAVLLRSLEHLTKVLAPPEPNSRTQRGPRTGYRSPRPAGRSRSARGSRPSSERRRRGAG